MAKKPTYEELEQRIRELEHDINNKASEIELLCDNLKEQKSKSNNISDRMDKIQVSGINIEWNTQMGTCSFENLPAAMMWIDTTLAGLMSGVQSMVGRKRFRLALQSEGRKSVEDDWKVISQFSDFKEGFKAIANIAAVAGWGDWRLISLDEKNKECVFQIRDSWEGLYQKAIGVCWGSGMLAGKMAGYCTKLFSTNCWADHTKFIAKGDEFDEFVVKPSDRSIEKEIENLLATNKATRADMAVALQRLRIEFEERKQAQEALKESEKKYRRIYDNILDVYYEANIDGIILEISPSIENNSKYKREELIGKSLYDVYTNPEERNKLIEALIADGRVNEYEINLTDKDDTQHICSINSMLIKDKNGNPIKIVGIMRDISDRKKG